jgi:hypothetical protein
VHSFVAILANIALIVHFTIGCCTCHCLGACGTTAACTHCGHGCRAGNCDHDRGAGHEHKRGDDHGSCRHTHDDHEADPAVVDHDEQPGATYIGHVCDPASSHEGCGLCTCVVVASPTMVLEQATTATWDCYAAAIVVPELRIGSFFERLLGMPCAYRDARLRAPCERWLI